MSAFCQVYNGNNEYTGCIAVALCSRIVELLHESICCKEVSRIKRSHEETSNERKWKPALLRGEESAIFNLRIAWQEQLVKRRPVYACNQSERPKRKGPQSRAKTEVTMATGSMRIYDQPVDLKVKDGLKFVY